MDEYVVAIASYPRWDDHDAAVLAGDPHMRQDGVIQQAVEFGPVSDGAMAHPGQLRGRH
jgi:hypothetical protein